MSTARPDPDDLTARARIRDAALFCFAQHGFSAPLRMIADRAGVSVPLITHHYGTKDALRQVCDDWVLERFTQTKLLAIQRPDSVRDTLADTSQASVLMVYMLRCFLDATSSALAFFERYKEQLRQIMAKAAEAGLVTTADDEEERLHQLASQSIGSLLVEFVIHPPADPRHFIDQAYTSRAMLTQLNLYTHPVFTPSEALQTYIASVRGMRGR